MIYRSTTFVADMLSQICKLWGLIVISLAVILIGCADEVGGVYLVEGQESTLHAVADQVTTVYFTAGDSWTATPTVDWLETSPQSGEGGRNSVSIITRLPNRTRKERIGQVIIASGGKQQTVQVVQLNEYASFEPKVYEVGPDGGEVNMSFETNIERGTLLLSYMKFDWVKMPNETANTRSDEWKGKVKTIMILPNDTPAERSAPFVLGIYDEKKQFLGLDTAWVQQKAMAVAVEP